MTEQEIERVRQRHNVPPGSELEEAERVEDGRTYLYWRTSDGGLLVTLLGPDEVSDG